MKKISIILSIVLLSVGYTFGQSTDTLKLFSVQELRADVDSLTKYIEETHPNPFYKFPRKEFYKEVDSIKSMINTPMSVIDFYLAIDTLIVKLEDGHTNIDIPIERYMKSNPCMFPYFVTLSVNQPFISVIRPYKTIISEIPSGAEIININGIESKNIVKDIIKCNSGESEMFRLKRGEFYFFLYLNKLFGMKDSYLVKYKINNEIETKTINGIKYDSLVKRQKQDTTKVIKTKLKDYTLKLIPETKTAIIDFISFNEPKKFKLFIDSAFRQIKDNKIENLIIDIRYNGGGDSGIGDEFFQYISPCTFKQFSKEIIKYSRLQKEDYKNIRVKFMQDSSCLKTLTKPNGLIEDISAEDSTSIKLHDNPLRFQGNIYLLTSAGTFSSAASFAQCFKYYKMGKIIGEETGGWIVCYGDNISTFLPNTKLDLTISHKLWYGVGAKENDFHGTIPDIIVPSEKALNYTLDLINKK